MRHNSFDKASRYAAQLEPIAYLSWLLGLPPEAFEFRRWLDTRLLSAPAGSERIGDTVAEILDLTQSGLPWALAIEFQIRPDADLCGRLLVYLGTLWLQQRPSAERGDRYCISAVVVNLTGQGNCSRSYRWPGAQLGLTLEVRERNLALEDAAHTLDAIGHGAVGRCVLPWLALMQGGSEPAFLARWLEVARGETNERRRSDYGALALIFAEAAKCLPVWKAALKGWNMIESQQVLEWMNEGRNEGRIEGERISARFLLLDLVEVRYGTVPEDLKQKIGTLEEISVLRELYKSAATATSLQQFRQETGL